MRFSFLKPFFYFLACSLLILTSCADDDEVDPAGADGEMTCKIDGVDWTAVAPVATILSGVINVSGISSDDMVVTTTLTGTTEGTYQLTPTLANAIVHTETSDGSTFAFASNQNQSNTNYGTVVITEIDTDNKTISGTFETEVHRLQDGTSKIITEGSFTKIPYSETTTGTTGSSLSANVNGVLFEAVSVSGFAVLGNLTLNGTDSQGSETIGITVAEDVAPGTYSLAGIGTPNSAQYNADTNTFLTANTGTLIITEHDIANKIIKGTFAFEASELIGANTASITGGVFDVSY